MFNPNPQFIINDLNLVVPIAIKAVISAVYHNNAMKIPTNEGWQCRPMPIQSLLESGSRPHEEKLPRRSMSTLTPVVDWRRSARNDCAV